MKNEYIIIGTVIILVIVLVAIYIRQDQKESYANDSVTPAYAGSGFMNKVIDNAITNFAVIYKNSSVNAPAPISCPPNISSLASDVNGNMIATTPVPIGTIIMWSGTDDGVPTGWGICDGTVYTSNYTLVGASAPLSVTSPDLTNRFVFGAGTTLANTRTPANEANQSEIPLGYTDGEFFHSLNIDEMPYHNHQIPTVNFGGTLIKSASGLGINDDGNLPSGFTGEGQVHNNMPPFYALTFLIKYNL